MKTEITYICTKEFGRDVVRLQKRFPSLPGDLENAKRSAVDLYHTHGKDCGGIFKVPGFQNGKVEIYKLKKFTCRSLKGRGAKTGIRVIYAFFLDSVKVVLIQMYFKSDTKKEDRKRIGKFLKDPDSCLEH